MTRQVIKIHIRPARGGYEIVTYERAQKGARRVHSSLRVASGDLRNAVAEPKTFERLGIPSDPA